MCQAGKLSHYPTAKKILMMTRQPHTYLQIQAIDKIKGITLIGNGRSSGAEDDTGPKHIVKASKVAKVFYMIEFLRM